MSSETTGIPAQPRITNHSHPGQPPSLNLGSTHACHPFCCTSLFLSDNDHTTPIPLPDCPQKPPRREIDRPRPERKVRRYLPLPSAPKRKLSSISDFGGLGERQRTE